MPGPVLGARTAGTEEGPTPLLCRGLKSSGHTGWVSEAATRTGGQVTRRHSETRAVKRKVGSGGGGEGPREHRVQALYAAKTKMS